MKTTVDPVVRALRRLRRRVVRATSLYQIIQKEVVLDWIDTEIKRRKS